MAKPLTKVTSSARDRVAEKQSAAQAKFAGSAAEHLWQRLNAMDFINRGMLFAAVLLLCFVPFLIVLQALLGRDTATSAIRRFGLSHAAAADLTSVLTSPTATSSDITGLSYVFFILAGVAAAGAIQELYEQAFEVEGRGMKDLPRRLLWLAVLIAAGALGGWVGGELHDVRGGQVLLGVLGLVALTAFWWFTMWLLLGGRRSWRELFPAALATSVCWLGMSIVFRLTMSDTITSDYKKYGSIGVVFALMSFLIAVGVVLILGAIVGVVWRERHTHEA